MSSCTPVLRPKLFFYGCKCNERSRIIFLLKKVIFEFNCLPRPLCHHSKYKWYICRDHSVTFIPYLQPMWPRIPCYRYAITRRRSTAATIDNVQLPPATQFTKTISLWSHFVSKSIIRFTVFRRKENGHRESK